MCSAPNVYMFVYILIGTHMVPLNIFYLENFDQAMRRSIVQCFDIEVA